LREEDAYDLQGAPEIREYEIRRGEQLVTLVSRQAMRADDAGEGAYRVEILKGEAALPLLAIVFGVEVALGRPADD